MALIDMALLRSAAYVLTAIWFAVTPGSAAGRIFLSISFLLWGVERAISERSTATN